MKTILPKGHLSDILLNIISSTLLYLERYEQGTKALTGLIGKVPMAKAVSAFISFFKSSGCEGIEFGELKYFLNEIMNSTFQELSNLKVYLNIFIRSHYILN